MGEPSALFKGSGPLGVKATSLLPLGVTDVKVNEPLAERGVDIGMSAFSDVTWSLSWVISMSCELAPSTSFARPEEGSDSLCVRVCVGGRGGGREIMLKSDLYGLPM